jgi:hypothetical protein
LLGFVLLLVVAGVVAYAVWDYRKKTAARAAASQARFEEMFKKRGASAPSPPESTPPSPAPAVLAAAAPPQALPTASVARAGDRFLGGAEALVYRLLRTGMPDHEVFAKVMLASVVGASGSGHQREQQLRRLSQYQVDFVLCDREMRIVAAVELETAGGAEAIAVRKFKEECLEAAGIHLVRIDAAAPPRADEIRLLLGAGAPRPSAH